MPGPKPKYQPEFETEEIAEARRIARQRTAPSSHVHRAKMVVILSEHPDMSHERLAQAVGVHPRTVMKWRKRWSVEGFSLLDQPRSGRPPGFFPLRASLKLRPSPANCQPFGRSRYPASASRSCFGKSVHSQRCRSPGARCGVSSNRTPFVPGFTDPGSLSRMRAFWKKRVPFWICIKVIMRACHWVPKTTS